MNDVYKQSDKEILRLKRIIQAEFHNATNLLPFDEINSGSGGAETTRKLLKALYARLVAQNRRSFKRIAKSAYIAAESEAKSNNRQSDKALRITTDEIVAALLSSYNAVSGYKYRTEIVRKRDRVVESVLASRDRNSIRKAMDRGAQYWFGQSTQYCDLSVDEARVRAFKDAGVKRVVWVTMDDQKVCSDCEELDGELFWITEIPPKPHPHCRCTIRPASEEDM